MSAFIVSNYHINALVSWAMTHKVQYFVPGDRRKGVSPTWETVDVHTAPQAAATLYAENVRSVNYRYNERTRTTGFEFKRVNTLGLTPAMVVRACDCLDYQSCEHRGWDKSQAKRILTAIREDAIRVMLDADKSVQGLWTLDDPAEA